MSILCHLYSDGRWRFFPLGLGGCSFACGASVCCLSASLCDFLCVVFCISLSSVTEGGSGGVPAEYVIEGESSVCFGHMKNMDCHTEDNQE
jgi:hypothetical protein